MGQTNATSSQTKTNKRPPLQAREVNITHTGNGASKVASDHTIGGMIAAAAGDEDLSDRFNNMSIPFCGAIALQHFPKVANVTVSDIGTKQTKPHGGMTSMQDPIETVEPKERKPGVSNGEQRRRQMTEAQGPGLSYLLIEGVPRHSEPAELAVALETHLRGLHGVQPTAPPTVMQVGEDDIFTRKWNVVHLTSVGSVRPLYEMPGWIIVRALPGTAAAIRDLQPSEEFPFSIVTYVTLAEAVEALETRKPTPEGHSCAPEVGEYPPGAVAYEAPGRSWQWDARGRLLGCRIVPCMDDWAYVINSDTNDVLAHVQRKAVHEPMAYGWTEAYTNGPIMRFMYHESSFKDILSVTRWCTETGTWRNPKDFDKGGWPTTAMNSGGTHRSAKRHKY